VTVNYSKGLVPAIIVNDYTNEVLMLAYVNEEAYQKMMETGETWFYSRSRNELWNKGATSGNKQFIKSIQLDCDQDTLLIRVDPQGPACHTGAKTCFGDPVFLNIETSAKKINNTSIFNKLMAEIEHRKSMADENSYTNYLFKQGIDKICKKVMEEAGEVVIAAKNDSTEEIVNEWSDLIFHCLVLLSHQNITLDKIEEELLKRHLKKGNFKGERPPITQW
jgi:phosphoribosyl-AMP cyclohydrolase / phosphoribosyl-ATP pyrophosphohydrolase